MDEVSDQPLWGVQSNSKKPKSKKETSKHLRKHLDELKMLCALKEEDCVDETQSQCCQSPVIDFKSVGTPLKFTDAVKMEYKLLDDIQLDITGHFLVKMSIPKIIEEILPRYEVVSSKPSLRTCILHTLMGRKWAPQMSGGTSQLPFLDELELEEQIVESMNRGKIMQDEEIINLAQLLFNGRKITAQNIIRASDLSNLKKEKIIFSIQNLEEPDFNCTWVRSYLDRRGLHLKNGELIEDMRAKYGTKGTIIRWFSMFKELTRGYKSRNIFNMDEMSITISESKKVIVKKGTYALKATKKYSIPHITACCCFSAAGKEISNFILMSEENISPALLDLQETGTVKFSSSKSGWMTRSNFSEWVDHFLEYLNRNNNPEEQKLLFLDSHNSRENEEALLKLKKNNIRVITFPPHNTHILQPFDVVIAKMLKSKIRAYFNKYIKKDNNLKKSEIIYLLILSIEAGWKTSINTVNAITAFSTTGLFPFDVSMPLQSKYVVDSMGDAELTEITQGKLRTTSRELTSEEYLTELRLRDNLKQFSSNIRSKVSTLVQLDNFKMQKNSNIQNVKDFLAFKPKKFISAIESIIGQQNDDDKQILIPSPITIYFNTSLLKTADLCSLDKRKTEWIHMRTRITDKTSYKQKIREFLIIAECTLGFSIPDFRVEDSFRREAEKHELLTHQRYEEIIANLEKVTNYKISDTYQALWLLAKISNGSLLEYQEQFSELPIDPLDDILHFKEMIMTMSEDTINNVLQNYSNDTINVES